jgi:hypothetical protein
MNKRKQGYSIDLHSVSEIRNGYSVGFNTTITYTEEIDVCSIISTSSFEEKGFNMIFIAKSVYKTDSIQPLMICYITGLNDEDLFIRTMYHYDLNREELVFTVDKKGVLSIIEGYKLWSSVKPPSTIYEIRTRLEELGLKIMEQ